MDQITMEKKNQPRPAALSNRSSFDLKSSDNYSKKNVSQYPRKRDNEKFDKKATSNRGGRTSQRYVRSREKVGGQVENVSEVGSLQRSGGKKQNLTRIDIQNWYSPLDTTYSNRGYHKGQKNFAKKYLFQHAKYKKEHYMQANCQFVVISGKDYSEYEKNPDTLVDWNFIEEVWLHMTESPACPICLHPPIVAKITRCGHIYCFSCVLHYLALSDKKWRKCPICEQIISKDDLKSVKPILHKNWKCGEVIELQLMRRDRDSLIPVPMSIYSSSEMELTDSLSNFDSSTFNKKLIIASSEEILKHIVNRELEDLQCQMVLEKDEPEVCFIETALSLVSERIQHILDSPTSDLKDIHPVECEGAEGMCFDESLSCEDSFNMSKELESPDDLLQIGNMSLRNCQRVQKESTSSTEDYSFSMSSPASEIISVQQKYALDDHSDVKIAVQPESPRGNGPKSTYYFYQEIGGSHIYLHALNIHMLTKEYGGLDNCPQTLTGKVLEKESESMTDSLRHRMRCLGHLPISCSFEVVEIDLGFPVISKLTKASFEDQLKKRDKSRYRRAREEHRVERRVKVEEDRLMGRTRGSYIHTTSFEHFPNFSATEDPPIGSFEDNHGGAASSLETTSPIAASPQSDACLNDGTVSFAQMIRDGQRKQPTKSAIRSPIKKEASAWPSVNYIDSDDEGERVPDFSAAFSADFAKALDRASQKVSVSDGVATDSRGKTRKKKKKPIVLLSSGGF